MLEGAGRAWSAGIGSGIRTVACEGMGCSMGASTRFQGGPPTKPPTWGSVGGPPFQPREPSRTGVSLARSADLVFYEGKDVVMGGNQRIVIRSGLDILTAQAHAAQKAAEGLVAHSEVRYDDINARGDFFFVGWNVWQWGPLPDEAQPFVGVARRAHDELITFARMVFEVGAPDRLREVDDLSRWLLRLVEQPNGSLPNGAPASSTADIAARIEPRIDEFLAEVGRLPTAHGREERLLVADTSALLDHPSIQDWRLDGEHWTIVLVPQVLAELDERKRDRRTVDAAQKVIRQIEEFSRRGDTFAGVPLAGTVSFREVPHSPTCLGACRGFVQTLPTIKSSRAHSNSLPAICVVRWPFWPATETFETRPGWQA
jgi:hypothetical protein